MVSLLAQRGRGEIMSVREMQDLGLPRSFLVKIARDLIDSGIIGAKEGRGGGYFLKKDPTKVSLREVVEKLEGRVATASCVHGVKCPMYDNCPHRKVMELLSDRLAGVLAEYMVSDLGKK